MSDTSRAILALGLGLLGVFLMVATAGTSKDAGRLMTVLAVGLWLVWLVRHPNAFSSVRNLGNLGG